MANDQGKIKITWDDVDKEQEQSPPPMAGVRPVSSASGDSWGTITPQTNPASIESSGGNLLLKGWFYLGAAGLIGAFLAWMLCEPAFDDGIYGPTGWGALMLLPVVVIFISVGLGLAESIIERSWKRAMLRGFASAGLGIVLGFIFAFGGGILFNLLGYIIEQAGIESIFHPLFWIRRSIAWTVFGIAGGLVFGIVSKSLKKTLYGMIGGAIGAAIGGLIFDPITMLVGGAEASRAIGLSIFGMSTGIAIGLVESALKDRWLYVSGGPLAGKQFVLYQDCVTLGRSQSSTIYLFKDPGILEQHAIIEHRAGKSFMTAYGPITVCGQSLHAGVQRPLGNGDSIQLGRYTFTYAEKERVARS